MENQKIFEQTIKEIETQFGKGSIISLDKSKAVDCEVISTGTGLIHTRRCYKRSSSYP